MGDLISKSKLSKYFERIHSIFKTNDLWDIKTIKDFIESEPVAFDVDKVVEQLTEKLNATEEELTNVRDENLSILMAKSEHLIGKQLAYQTAIDIIRKGGIE